MSQVRGATVLGTVDFIRERWGAEGLQRVLTALGAPSRQALGGDAGSLLVNGWYDAAAFIELNTTMDHLFGAGDLALAREAARHTAFADLGRFFKWLLRMGGPKALFSRAGSVWSNYYSEGRYVAEEISANRVTFRIDGCSFAHPVLCRRLEGWTEKGMELTLGRDVKPAIRELQHRAYDPKLGSDKFCRYTAAWGG
jgi:hypothetical protein